MIGRIRTAWAITVVWAMAAVAPWVKFPARTYAPDADGGAR